MPPVRNPIRPDGRSFQGNGSNSRRPVARRTSSAAKPTESLESPHVDEVVGGAMHTAPQRPKQFWTERRALLGTFLVAGAVLVAVVLYAAPWRPAYIQSIGRCNLAPDQICFDVNIRFNSVVANGTMHLLTVALQNGAEYWTRDYGDYNGYTSYSELDWGVIIPVNATVINSYSFHFTLFVNGAQVDSRTVGWQGG